jgi:CubicO group peptidase (beta-lactamase class C family)
MLAGMVLSQSTFDADLFAANLEEQIPVDVDGPNGVVGFSYAIIDGDPNDPIVGADGNRRMSWDGPLGIDLPASANQPQEIASISKAITGAAILHLLQEQTNSVGEIETILNLPAISYLPTDWFKSAFFSTITVRELLTHTSGIRNASLGTSGAYDYASLRAIGAQLSLTPPIGLPWYQAFPKVPSYHTTNFAYFRVMLPYMWNAINNSALSTNAELDLVSMSSLVPDNGLRADIADAIEADWGIEPLTSDVYSITPDRLTASIYKFYVSEYILKPSGIEDPQTRTPQAGGPIASNNFTLLYPLDPTIQPGTDVWPNNAGGPPTPMQVLGTDTGNQTRFAGSRGWNLSAVDVAKFLSGIRHGAISGTPILEAETRSLMDDQGLGWRHSTNTTGFVGDFGLYYGHDGVNFSPSPLPANAPNNAGLGPMNNTVAMAFPNGVEAALLINSQIQSVDAPAASATLSVIGAAFSPSGTTGGTTNAMREAYDNAWTHVVYEGDTGLLPPFADDVFVLRGVAGTTDWIELLHDGVIVMQRRMDTLNSLEIRGLRGDDTLTLQNLPSLLNLDLTFKGDRENDTVSFDSLPVLVNLVVNGDSGSDTVIVGSGSLNSVYGTVNFNGGSGSDSIVFDDSSDVVDSRLYTVNASSFSRSSTVFAAYSFSALETVRVQSGQGDNTILVTATSSGTAIEIASGSGDDQIEVGDGNAAANINDSVVIEASSGNDLLIIDDRNSLAAHDYYVFQEDYFQSGFIPVISWDAKAPPNSIQLLANQQDSTTNIQDVLPEVTLTVYGHGGDDLVNVHASQSDSVIDFRGGNGNDTLQLTSSTNLLDSVQGSVMMQGGVGANDRVILYDESFQTHGGRQYRVEGQNIDLVNSTFGSLVIPTDHGLERVDIYGGVLGDLFDVRSWSVTTLLSLNGGSGSDELRVSSVAHNLNSIVGPLHFDADPQLIPGMPSPDNDIVTIHDDLSGGSMNYTIEAGPDLKGIFAKSVFELNHLGVEQLTLLANDAGNSVHIAGATSVLHKANYFLNVGGGDDTIEVQAPAAATIHTIGGHGVDSLFVYGTSSADELTLVGDQLDVSQVGFIGTTTVVIGADIENSNIDVGGGLDVLIVEGQAGLNEEILLQTSGIPGSGTVSMMPFLSISFSNLEDVDVNGNPSDSDTFQFIGSSNNDTVVINPVGMGTTVQPFVHILQSNGSSLLKLRDATNVGVPSIRGGEGSDLFRVTIFPSGMTYPIRDLHLDAGEDAGNSDLDQLIISYNTNAFLPLQPPASASNGLLQFGNGLDILDILYENFERLLVAHPLGKGSPVWPVDEFFQK